MIKFYLWRAPMKQLITYLLLATSIISTSMAADLDAIVKAKKIKIAVDTTYPPMEFESLDGKIIGLDVDLARELAKILKVEAEFVVMPWDGILAGLQSSRYDVIMSSMNITPERQAQVNFVPYITMGQVFVVKKTGTPIKNEKDLAGKTVAVQVDTTSFAAVEAIQKSGVKIKAIKTFPGATETFSALKANQAEVIVIDEVVGKYYTGLDSKTFLISGNAMKPEPIGIAVKKTDAKLLKALTDAVAEIKKNGTYARVYKHWLKTEPAL
jgi:polar amino acid transport system substrate-binding protein